MDNRKIYIPGLVLGIVSFIVGVFAMPIEAFILGIISLILNIRKKKNYRTKAAIIVTVIGMIINTVYFAFMCWSIFEFSNTGSSYWFFELFGKGALMKV